MNDDLREARLAQVAAQRLGWVRCAVEHVHHRHNASAILRTCDALGVHHVHLVGKDRFQPSRGPSMGAARWLALHRHPTPREALDALAAEGVDLWVADLSPEAVTPADLPLDRPVCLWFGAEVLGVGAEAREAARGVVTVPMRGFAQSLNVSVAAALALHVVAERTRREHGAEARLSDEEREATLTRWLARERADHDAIAARTRALELLGQTVGSGLAG
ncbi:MAG: RNA methyltransferase [Alphaproteobacteria bacterium]|nr:RNA methyltransferase [Alphaproteobacteria bacterium]